MTIAVSGVRRPLTRAEENLVRSILTAHSERTVHVGDCPTGVDKFVRDYCSADRVKVFAADWTRGQSAGPIRNGRMLKGCEILIAFPGAAHSPGTRNAIEQAIRAGIETHVYPLKIRE